MKQHITREQMEEVNFTLLLGLLGEHTKHRHEFIKELEGCDFKKYIFPRFTIGKMIEILEENIPKADGVLGINRYKDNIAVNVGSTEKSISFGKNGNCLCDLLWEAIKYVIKESKI